MPIAMEPTPNTHSAPALRTFEAIADAWKLTAAERARVLGMPEPTYFRTRRDPTRARLSVDQLERVSHILGIYKSLHILLPREDVADGWLSLPNRDFGGEPARRVLTSGRFSDVVRVRQYLDAERAW